MIETIQETLSPQVCAAKIFEISGTFLQMIASVRPSLTEGMIEDFQKDSIAYARA